MKHEYNGVYNKAIRLLQRGDGTLAEIAHLAGVSRQLVRLWADRAAIDWAKARAKRLKAIWEKARE